MTDRAAEHGAPHGLSKRLDAWLEIGTAIILSVTALVTSWSAYQASLWDGEQAAHYTTANAQHMAASRLSTRAGQLQALDAMSFAQWVDAFASGNPKLQAFYEARFRPEFRVAFQTWLARHPLNSPGAPTSPFDESRYSIATQAQAEATEQAAAREFDEGEKANTVSDHYVQGSVMLASALFFGGMCQVFRTPKVRMALLAVAAIACLMGVVKILSLPALRL